MDYAAIIGIVALLLLHVFRSPKEQSVETNRTIDKVEDKAHRLFEAANHRIDILEAEIKEIKEAARKRELEIAVNHMDKASIEKMLEKELSPIHQSLKEVRSDLKTSVDYLRTSMDSLRVAILKQDRPLHAASN